MWFYEMLLEKGDVNQSMKQFLTFELFEDSLPYS
jgi:hypothetical protein